MNDNPKVIYVDELDLVCCQIDGVSPATIASSKELLCDTKTYYHESEVEKLKKELCDFLIFINKKHQKGEIEMPSYATLRMIKLKEEICRCREGGANDD